MVELGVPKGEQAHKYKDGRGPKRQKTFHNHLDNTART